MRERIAQLEAETARLRASGTKAHSAAYGSAPADASLVEELRRDLSKYKARASQLEQDFVALEVRSADAAAASGADSEVRQALTMAGAFKTR